MGALERSAEPAAEEHPGGGLGNHGLDGPADVVELLDRGAENAGGLQRRHRSDVGLPPLRFDDGDVHRPLDAASEIVAHADGPAATLHRPGPGDVVEAGGHGLEAARPEQRHHLVVDVLVEPPQPHDEAPGEVALHPHVEVPRALRPQPALTGHGGERTLGRKPQARPREGQEGLRARCDHVLRPRDPEAQARRRRHGDGRARAEEPAVDVVVPRVAAAVLERQARRHRPSVEGADARGDPGLGREAEGEGVRAVVALAPVRRLDPERMGAAGLGQVRPGREPRRDVTGVHRPVRGPVAPPRRRPHRQVGEPAGTRRPHEGAGRLERPARQQIDLAAEGKGPQPGREGRRGRHGTRQPRHAAVVGRRRARGGAGARRPFLLLQHAAPGPTQAPCLLGVIVGRVRLARGGGLAVGVGPLPLGLGPGQGEPRHGRQQRRGRRRGLAHRDGMDDVPARGHQHELTPRRGESRHVGLDQVSARRQRRQHEAPVAVRHHELGPQRAECGDHGAVERVPVHVGDQARDAPQPVRRGRRGGGRGRLVSLSGRARGDGRAREQPRRDHHYPSERVH